MASPTIRLAKLERRTRVGDYLRLSAKPMTPRVRWRGHGHRILAAILLVPATPVILFLIVMVRLTSRGPGLYRQVRVGLHGRPFVMYKVRTMLEDAEAKTGPIWASPEDLRVTSAGKVMRELHLDELPQLINVLKGEMALVGPRPERPEFVAALAETIPGYIDRLSVRPGITGLAQLRSGPDTDLDSVRRKLTLDLEYVRSASLALDLRVLVRTVFKICFIAIQAAARDWKFRPSIRGMIVRQDCDVDETGDGAIQDSPVRRAA